MINIPERYEVNQEIKLKNLILKEFKPDEKKKIKEYIKSVTLKYMINDEEIPSVEDERYIFKVIQYFEFEISDIKKAGFLANLYQETIKSPCVLRFYDNSKEVYSLALKRLNQNDRNEIVVTDTVMTEIFELSMSSSAKREVEGALDYSKILNRTNKVNFYLEMFIKNYILKNQKYYQKSGNILESLIWYDRNKMNDIFEFTQDIIEKEDFERLREYNIRSDKEKEVILQFYASQGKDIKNFMLFENKKFKASEKDENFKQLKADVKGSAQNQSKNDFVVFQKDTNDDYYAIHQRYHQVHKLDTLIGKEASTEYMSRMNTSETGISTHTDFNHSNGNVSEVFQSKKENSLIEEVGNALSKSAIVGRDTTEDEFKKRRKKRR